MTTVTKTVKFDAAHILTNHQGLCKNLHGHTYKVEISCSSDLPGTGTSVPEDMVIDFKELKNIATAEICDRFDHAFIYNSTSAAECEIAAVVKKYGMRTVELPFRSTAENLAKYFYEILASKVNNLEAVKVWETADSSAEYKA